MTENKETILDIMQQKANKLDIDLPSEMEMYESFDSEEFSSFIDDEFSVSDTIGIGSELKRLQLLSFHSSDTGLGSSSYAENMSVGDVLDCFLSVEISLAKTGIDTPILEQIAHRRQDLASRYEDIDDQIAKHDVLLVVRQCSEWIEKLKADFDDIHFFMAYSNTHINIKKLVDSPSAFFDDAIWDWLDEQPKTDFREACRALAYNSPTASVMLSLRAVEYCLRIWYEYDTGREIEQRTWGQVISELEDLYEDSQNRPPILSNLDYLRERRNAVSHTEDSPSNKEAERMIYHIEGTISEIYSIMSKKQK